MGVGLPKQSQLKGSRYVKENAKSKFSGSSACREEFKFGFDVSSIAKGPIPQADEEEKLGEKEERKSVESPRGEIE